MSSTQDEGGGVVRLSINLAPDVADVLKATATRHGRSITETVRIAVAVLHYIDTETSTGATVCVYKDGELREVKVIWG